jgi:hypothetical protein
MANAFTNFLGQVITGGGSTNVKDYSHASRLYVDDYFRLAPKAGFLYYVKFNINRNGNPIVEEYIGRNGQELGLMVKMLDLPKYKMSTETMNQYNKKTIVQSKIDYTPVNITFHDDNNNTTTGMWKAYYNYYFVDGKNTSGLSIPPGYKDSKYKKPGASISESTSFGLNNGQTDPFFNSIEIYQLNRKQFTAFILVNPIITDYSHDQLDQSQSKGLENKMTVAYETVLYGTGVVKQDSPSGFASIHYDNTPGPLSIFGGGNNSLFGPGGIVPGIGEVLGGGGNTSPLGLLKTARGAANIFNNTKNISKASILSEGYSILDKVARGQKLTDVLSGSSSKGLALATLPGEKATTGIPKLTGADGLAKAIGGVTDTVKNVANKLGDKLKGLLPSTVPTTKAGLSALQAEQTAIASDIEARIAANQIIKDDLIPQLAAAQAANDTDQVASIYSQLDAADYTDPDKLTEQLNSVTTNIQTLSTLIAEADAIETPNSTLSAETIDLGVAEEDVYNVGSNPDLVTQVNITYTENTGNTPQFYV